MKLLNKLGVLVLVYSFDLGVLAQSRSLSDDLKKVVASSAIEKNLYSNDYVGFRLTLPDVPCTPTLNPVVDLQRGNAILLRCQHVVQGWQGMYTLTITIDYRANYASLHGIEHYVRSMRHVGERGADTKTVQTEQPRRMAGKDFVEAILSTNIPSGRSYYQGLSCTQIAKYLVCFEMEAPSVDEVHKLLSLEGRLEITAEHATK